MAFNVKRNGVTIMSSEPNEMNLGAMMTEEDPAAKSDRIGLEGLKALEADDIKTAITKFDESVSINNNNVPSLNNLAVSLWRGGFFLDSAKCARRAFEISGSFSSLANFSNAIHSLGDLETAVASARQTLMINPGAHDVHSMLLMELSLWDKVHPYALAAEHKAFSHWVQNSNPGRVERTNKTDVLRVGYLSPDLRQHSVAWFTEGVLREHDRSRVQVYVYSTGKPDEITKRIFDNADAWIDGSKLTKETLAHLIKKDGLDILVEMGGHTAGNNLSTVATRLAPVQCNWLGYPNSTGVPAIDYKITDFWTVGRGMEFHYSEKLARINKGSHAFIPGYKRDVVVNKSKSDHVRFGSFNRLCKMTQLTVGLWSEVLKAVEGSTLTIKTQGMQDQNSVDVVDKMFSSAGVDPRRIVKEIPNLDTCEHLERYNDVDIALDALPYSGTTTTCEALWMGTPVVSGTGQVPQARVGESILRSAQCADMVANSVNDYVRLAKSLAENKEERISLNHSLRQRMIGSHLGDGKRVASALEGLYAQMIELHTQGETKDIEV
jgi:predicted O-linked N-acetylglucosamine transferase (SPINDLY family)